MDWYPLSVAPGSKATLTGTPWRQTPQVCTTLRLLNFLTHERPALDPKSPAVVQHEYFYKDPKACDPAELPQYEASHEMDMKQKRSRLKEAGPHAPHADNGHDMKRQRLGGPPLSYPPQGYAFSTCPVACPTLNHAWGLLPRNGHEMIRRRLLSSTLCRGKRSCLFRVLRILRNRSWV